MEANLQSRISVTCQYFAVDCSLHATRHRICCTQADQSDAQAADVRLESGEKSGSLSEGNEDIQAGDEGQAQEVEFS